MRTTGLALALSSALVVAPRVFAQPPGQGSQGPGGDVIRQGVRLDLDGKYEEAREQFSKALETATSPQGQAQALRSMAMSYAFEGKCKDAVTYESRLYQIHLTTSAFFDAGEVANELARVCIDSGDLDEAQKWYSNGHDAGLRELNIAPARVDLWNFRWEHAQGRIAARRGNKAEAQKHVAAAKAILDKNTNPEQAVFFPYLVGYVALYGGDYPAALAELQKANQSDPFILCLIAQTYEKMSDRTHALEYYKKALDAASGHNPPTAYARPLAKKKLGVS